MFDRIREGRRPVLPVSAHTERSLIWPPDAGRATGLIGNTPDAYGQTWNLPTDPHRLAYAQMIDVASEAVGRRVRYTTVPETVFRLGGLVNRSIAEASELLPRYRVDNVFDSSKFATRFPEFAVTTYREGITAILR